MKKFLKLLLLLIPLLFYAQWGIGQVVINEVQPDPGNGEGGIGEFIELYCPAGGGPCNVDCFIVATDDNNIFTIPSTTPDIPAGGYLLVYNSATAGLPTSTGDFNGWNAAAFGSNVIGLDIATCSCQGGAGGIIYDNGPLFSANGDGQRIVLFNPSGTIIDAVAYCSQAGAGITSGLYSEDPDGCGAGAIGSTAGTQPEGLAYTWGTCGSFSIPNPGGTCAPPTSIVLPARGDVAYENAAFCLGGCSSSVARGNETDSLNIWVDDNSPTPGRRNNTSAADVVASCTSGTCTTTNFALKSYNIRHHENNNFSDAVTVCSGNPFTITFTGHLDGFADPSDGAANAPTSAPAGNTTVNSTRTATSNPAPTISAVSGTGVRTVTQTTTFNAAAMTAGTFTLTFAMRESYKSGTNSNIGSAPECYYKYTVNVTVTDIAPPTAPNPPTSVCYNGVGTITLPFSATPSATPAGNTIEWFDAASGGTSLGTGNTLNITNFTPTGPYPQTVTRYAETVTADGCCRSVSRTAVNVIINQAPSITASSNSPVCEGSTLTLTSTPSNTVGTPTFAWAGPSSYTASVEDPASFTAATTSGGTYTVTVTNGSNTCTASATTLVVVNPRPSITASSNSPVCTGNDISLTSTPTSGTTPYSINWTGPNSYSVTGQNPPSFAATTAAAGTYTVSVTDAKGCASSSTTAVVVGDKPSYTATVRCTNGSGTNANQNSYYVEINGLTAATTYNISISGGSAGTGAAGLDGGLSASGLTGKTTYILGPIAYATTPITVSVTNTAASTCPVTAQLSAILCGYTVVAGTDNVQNDLNASGYFCGNPATTGSNPGTPGILSQAAPIVANSGTTLSSQYVYVLFNDAGATVGSLDGTDVVLATNQTGLFPNLVNGTYYVKAFTIPTADIAAFTAAISGATNTAVTTASAPYCSGDCGSAKYVLNCCDAEAGTITNTDITSCEMLAALNFTTTVTGNKVPDANYGYAYLLVDAAGNVTNVNATGVFNLSTLNVTSQTTYKVYGMSYRIADIPSIPGATTAIADLIGDPIAAIIADASQLPTGTQFCGDLTDGSFDITINPNPTATISGITSYCGAGGTASAITATGGGTYLWSTGATTASITPNIASLGSTDYIVTVTSAAGCAATASTTVCVNQLVNVCKGTDITASTTGCNVTAPYAQMFLLTDASGSIIALDATTTDCAATFPTTALTAGATYKVYALNYDTTNPPVPVPAMGVNVSSIGSITKGCYNESTFLCAYKCYQINALPVASIGGITDFCGTGATTTLTAGGGGTYLWSTNATTAGITPSIAAVGSTTYTVTVTSTTGCTATATKMVCVNPLTNVCQNTNIVVTGATCS